MYLFLRLDVLKSFPAALAMVFVPGKHKRQTILNIKSVGDGERRLRVCRIDTWKRKKCLFYPVKDGVAYFFWSSSANLVTK